MQNGADELIKLALKSNKKTRVRAGAQQIDEIKQQFRNDVNQIRYNARNRLDADAEIRIKERDARKKLADVYNEISPLVQNDPALGDALHYAVYDLHHEGSLSALANRFEAD